MYVWVRSASADLPRPRLHEVGEVPEARGQLVDARDSDARAALVEVRPATEKRRAHHADSGATQARKLTTSNRRVFLSLSLSLAGMTRGVVSPLCMCMFMPPSDVDLRDVPLTGQAVKVKVALHPPVSSRATGTLLKQYSLIIRHSGSIPEHPIKPS